MSDQSLNGFKCYYKESGENIVKSILYACAISCMSGPMSKMLESPTGHLFQLTVGFLWFLFYSAYLFDEIRFNRNISKTCLPYDLVGWMFFLGQSCTLRVSGNCGLPILLGCLGIVCVSVSLWVEKREQKKDNLKTFQRCASYWLIENILIVLLLAVLWGLHSFKDTIYQNMGQKSFHGFIIVSIIGVLAFITKICHSSKKEFSE